MEGLLDHGLRDILTRVGGVDRCVSEFIRITDQLLPSRSFVRVVPELKHGSRTPAGVPVRPQLLGSDPVCLAENAARLAELAPAGIDLNFGCPAKTVNRHRGGVVLMDEPELKHGSRTPAGVPVRPHLLGSDPGCLAENAARLAELAPAGIDLNFGCPAKTVNRHRGGAVLLDEPELIHAIVAAVRRAVPAPIAVSAKMRLGNADDARLLDCAHAIASAGASELAVHARTKAHGYRPPAYWESIAAVREAVRLPVIANGEIWSADDAARCRQVTGCSTLMLGRGMVRRPGLALAIRAAGQPAAAPRETTASYSDAAVAALPWRRVVPLLADFWADVCGRVERRHRAGRLKQWLNYLRVAYPEAQQAFDALRAVNDPDAISAWVLRIQELPAPASTALQPEKA